MKVLPDSSRGRLALLLLPFRAFALLAAPSVMIWGSVIPRHSYVGDVGVYVVLGYVLSGLAMIIVGVIQLATKSVRDTAVFNLVWGLIAILVGRWLAPMFAPA